MHKSFAVLTFLTAVALAQNTLIPSNISDTCKTFLNTLDADKTVAACTSALVDATSAYAPGSDATKNPSSAKVTSTLSGLCAASIDTACPDTLIGDKLTSFYSSCKDELTSNVNNDVFRNYEVLYNILPFRTALCTKDDAGNFCAVGSKLPSSTDETTLQKALTVSTSGVVLPSSETIRDSGLLFLFTQATAASSDLCTSCTRKIMNAYTTYEGKQPFGPGLGKSILLANQTTLYTAISNTCGSSFLSEAGVVKAAGGLSGGTFSSNGALSVSAGSSLVFASMGAVLYTVLSAL
jgi:hypothetical protein